MFNIMTLICDLLNGDKEECKRSVTTGTSSLKSFVNYIAPDDSGIEKLCKKEIKCT